MAIYRSLVHLFSFFILFNMVNKVSADLGPTVFAPGLIKLPYNGYKFTIDGYKWSTWKNGNPVTSATLSIAGLGSITGFTLNVGDANGISSIVCNLCNIPQQWSTSPLDLTLTFTTSAGPDTPLVFSNSIQWATPVWNSTLTKISVLASSSLNIVGQGLGTSNTNVMVKLYLGTTYQSQLLCIFATEQTHLVCSLPTQPPNGLGPYNVFISYVWSGGTNVINYYNVVQWTTPVITSFTPTSMSKTGWFPGGPITLTGTNFGTNAALYSGTNAVRVVLYTGQYVLSGSITSITDTSIVANLSPIYGTSWGTGLVVLTWPTGNYMLGTMDVGF